MTKSAQIPRLGEGGHCVHGANVRKRHQVHVIRVASQQVLSLCFELAAHVTAVLIVAQFEQEGLRRHALRIARQRL